MPRPYPTLLNDLQSVERARFVALFGTETTGKNPPLSRPCKGCGTVYCVGAWCSIDCMLAEDPGAYGE